MTADPASHEAHDFPLAERIVEDAIRTWLNTGTGLALAASGGDNPVSDYERGVIYGIETMRYLHLDNYAYTVVPAIIDALRRAGRLK